MKQSIVCLLMILALGGCTQKNKSLLNDRIYYAIKPENFLTQTKFDTDTIIMETLTRNGEPNGNDRSVFKIHKTIWKDKTCFLYVEQFIISVASTREVGFSVLGCTMDGPNKLLLTAEGKTFPTLKECERQKLWIPDDYFAITIYSSMMLDSFKRFKNITDLDSMAVCLLKERVNKEYKQEEQKINEFAKRDIYLSETTKELLTRALIDMHVNPGNFTNEEADGVFKMCLTQAN